jgi:hypothetical protein
MCSAGSAELANDAVANEEDVTELDSLAAFALLDRREGPSHALTTSDAQPKNPL